MDHRLLRVVCAAPAGPVALVAATALNVACTLLLPGAVGAAADSVLDGGSGGAPTLRLAVLLAGAVLGGAGIKAAEAYCTADATGRLRSLLLERVLAHGTAAERSFGAGDLSSRVVTGAPQAAKMMVVAVSGVGGLGMSIGGLIALWLIDWRLVATVSAAVPLGLVLMRLFVRRATDLSTRYQELQAEISSRMLDAQTGVRTIRGAGTWRREADRVLAPLPELAGSGRALWRAFGRMQGQGTLLVPLTGLAALAVAGQGVMAGRTTPGSMIAVAGYAPMALTILAQVPFLLRLARLRAGVRRVTDVLHVPVPLPGGRPLPPGQGELSLRGVTVLGPDGPLLHEVDLTVSAGWSLAVVGRSGAGKTTLARVAGGLITPDSGEVLLDGVPLADLEPTALRGAIAHAFERPELLGTTVADTITYGAGPLPAGRVELALARARADGFVRLLPEGTATPLRDAPLSGGEIQRLGLARALVRDARLLVLDDATSSLDSVTEAQVEAALADANARTRLVVAHRAGTAAHADLVAWIDDGRVRALGPHRELWADPRYRAQFSVPENDR
ncbi:ABC transporter ATP-binding protein [Actinomadura vinacea]|uniref:ABC transporter ATP-binding protein n=1 Tax=Actinomadura vinacea TaxID=115336 RepID=A0ABN3JJH6_9ACTN